MNFLHIYLCRTVDVGRARVHIRIVTKRWRGRKVRHEEQAMIDTSAFEFDLHFFCALEAFRRGDLFETSRCMRFALGAANRAGCKRRRSAAFRVQNWLRMA